MRLGSVFATSARLSPEFGERCIEMGKASVIIDDFIAVDYFARTPSIKYFFLTHAHADHFSGLNNTWSRAQIYCTRETAQILPVLTARAPQLNGIDKRWLTVLEVNVCHEMDGFWVTPLEANHVPGAVMYLFEGPAIKSGPVLCTGDFRADTKFYAQKSTILLLQQHLFKTIYLDNTYLKSAIQEFPSYEESLQEVVNVISEIPKESKIYFITNRVGREQFLVDLSRKIQERIGLDSGRWAVAEVLGLSKHFTAKGENTRIRTCRRRDARKVLKDEGTFVIELTMLGHLKPNAITQHARARAVDYSDHCSPNELRDFLSLLKFRQLVGCAEPLSAARLNELRSLTLLAENGQASSAGANENDAGSDLRSDLELVASEVNTESSTIKRNLLVFDSLVNRFMEDSIELVGGEEAVEVVDVELDELISRLDERLDVDKILDGILSSDDVDVEPSSDAVMIMNQKEHITRYISSMVDDRFESYRAANNMGIAPDNVRSNAADMVDFEVNQECVRANRALILAYENVRQQMDD